MSGVHTDLKAGLRALGVDADVATFGDHHKRFPTDVRIGSTDPGLANAIGRVTRQFAHLLTFRKYDIIQSISSLPFNRAITRLMEISVLSTGGPKYVYVSASSDSFYRNHCRSLDYWPPHDWYRNKRIEKLERRISARAAAVVTPLWDYWFTMREAGFEPVLIPLPVDLTKIAHVPVASRERLVVYHPLNRAEGNDFKGTSYIRAAFDQLRREFPDVDFVEKGGMSFDEYSRFTKSVDIIVDQACSYSFAMSALYGLAAGQVVLSGNEPRTHELGYYAQSPVINIRPNVESVSSALRGLLSDRRRVAAIGRAGRSYAEQFHNAETVARQYLDLYERLMGRKQLLSETQR